MNNLEKHALAKQQYEGKVFDTLYNGKFIVEKYVRSKDIHIRFLETGYRTTTTINNIKNGKISDRMKPKLFGVGVLGDTKTSKHPKEYALWNGMLYRCYVDPLQNNPSYVDCSVSENFKVFEYFKEWCNNQVGFGNKGWHLDKDILSKGEKIYSENTCCFVPSEINIAFRDGNSCEKSVGVRQHKSGTWESRISVGGKLTVIGTFITQQEAFTAYISHKETYIKTLAEKWRGKVDERVYEALVKYRISII